MLRGNFGFFEKNRAFSFTLGAVYWLFAFVLTSLWRLDVGVIEYVLLLAGFYCYDLYQETKFRWATLADNIVHAALHFAAIWSLSSLALWFYPLTFPAVLGHWFFWAVALLPIIPIGGPIAGFVFGLNLYFTCRFGARNNNDAFQRYEAQFAPAFPSHAYRGRQAHPLSNRHRSCACAKRVAIKSETRSRSAIGLQVRPSVRIPLNRGSDRHRRSRRAPDERHQARSGYSGRRALIGACA